MLPSSLPTFEPSYLAQGFGMSQLFVPLTTIAMDPVPRERLGNATSLLNLMRNLGGSVGIAMTGTMPARHNQSTTALLAANVTRYDPSTHMMCARMRGALMASGADAVTATNRAYAALGILFIALVPFVLLMKRPKSARPAPAH